MTTMTAEPTEQQRDAASAGPAPHTRHRGLAWLLVVVVALVAAFFAVDVGMRAYAQNRFAQEIRAALPQGVSAPGLEVRIHGFSFLAQYLVGRFGQVDVDAPTIRTGAGEVGAHVTGTDVAFDRTFSRPLVVDRLSGQLRASEEAINRLVTLPDATSSIGIGAGTVSYQATAQVLGLPISYRATVRPEAAGDVVKLYPVSLDVASGSVDFDVKQLIGGLFSGTPVPVCVAPYLPKGLDVSRVVLVPHQAQVDFTARRFTLDDTAFSAHDSCPAA